MQRVSADEAVKFIRSNDTIVVGGSGGGHAVPEALMAALERRFLNEGLPRNITAVHPVGLGDGATKGANHFAHEGLLKRIVCGTFVNSPKISDMAIANKIEGYTLPQGALSQLMREIAAGRPGLLTKTGLHTFVDPRHGGGRQSQCAPEGLVELVDFRGEEYLLPSSRSTSTSASCAAPPLMKTATSPWSRKPSFWKCCRRRRRPSAVAAW